MAALESEPCHKRRRVNKWHVCPGSYNTAKSLTPKILQKHRFSAIYDRMAGSDAWKMFLCIFQDFDFLKKSYFVKTKNLLLTLFSCIFLIQNLPLTLFFLYITHSKYPFDTVFLYITYSKSPFDTVLGSLPPPRGLCACLRRFGDLRKNTLLDF